MKELVINYLMKYPYMAVETAMDTMSAKLGDKARVDKDGLSSATDALLLETLLYLARTEG